MAAKGFGGWGQQPQIWQQQTQQARPQAGWGQVGAPQAWTGQGAAQQTQGQSQTSVSRQPVQGQVEVYLVTTKGNDTEEVVIKTLTGEYIEKGSNHGRKVYQKTSGKGSMDFVEVYLYYWDSRDGPAFEGWWFGNKLGGTQVWSHCRDSGLKPPPSGWKIPWDGTVRPTLSVSSKNELEQHEAAERSRVVSAEVQSTVTAVEHALLQSQQLAGDYSSVESLTLAEQCLSPQMPQLMGVQKKLTEAQKGATGETARTFAQFAMQLRTVQNSLNTELTKVRGSKTKAETDAAQRKLEARDSALLEGILPEATERANAAEDMVEKTAITAEMITAAGDDMKEVKRAVDDTENAGKQAQASIGEARIFINAKLATVKRFESEKVKAHAIAELGKLQNQLQQAQTKLNPLKQCRQEFAQRAAAQRMIAEILEKLSPAEVDVDRAEETSVSLENNATPEQMQQVEEAVSRASDHLESALKFIEDRSRGTQGIIKDEVSKMEGRARQAQDKLTKIKASHREAQERVTLDVVLKEASEKMENVQEAVNKAADAEGPFLMGVEELPLNDTLTAVRACESAANTANTAIALTRAFIATKLVDVRRMSAGPAAQAKKRLQEQQQVLDNLKTRNSELQKNNAKRKAGSLMREASALVERAEDAAKQVSEAAAPLSDDSKLLELTAEQMRQAGLKTAQGEKAATLAINEAKKFVTARQIDAKGKDSSDKNSAGLLKFQSRLSSAQLEVNKHKSLSQTLDQRLAAKRSVEEAAAKIQVALDKVVKVESMVEDLGKLSPEELGQKKDGALPTKKIELASADAQASLKSVGRFLEMQSRSSPAKDEVGKLQEKIAEHQEKLDVAVQKMRAESEKLLVAGIMNEAEEKTKEAEEVMNKASEVEKAFMADKDKPVDEATISFDVLEKAVQNAHSTVGGAKTFLAMKRLAAKRLAESAAATTTEGLTNCQKRLDSVVMRLNQAKATMAGLKTETVKREAGAKVELLEKKVQAAVEATKFLVGMELDAMKAACEAAGKAQTDAGALLAEVRSILLTRQREAKSASSDAKLLLDLKDLLDKLTPLSASLDKQKSSLKEQEQKFVADRLKQESEERLTDLQAKMEATAAKGASLVGEAHRDWIASIYLQNIVETLRAHSEKEKLPNLEALFDAIAGSDKTLNEAKWICFIQNLPEVKAAKDAFFSEEQLRATFARLGVQGGDGKAEFFEAFKTRYIVSGVVAITDNESVKAGKSIRKLEVGEFLEGLSEPVRDDAGLMRVKAKMDKDGTEGFVTLSGNQGTVFLEPFSAYAAHVQQLDEKMKELNEGVAAALRFIEQKCQDLKAATSGPLATTKSELTEMRPKVRKMQVALTDLRRKVSDGRRRVDQCMQVEKQRRDEVADKREADKLKDEALAALTPVETEMEKVLPTATELIATKAAGKDDPLKCLSDAEAEVGRVSQLASHALETIKTLLDNLMKKNSQKGPFLEARSTLIKHKGKAGALAQKCQKQLAALRSMSQEIVQLSKQALIKALKAHAQSQTIHADDLFRELSAGQQCIAQSALRDYMKKIPNSGLSAAQLDLGLSAYEVGMTKLGLCGLLQEYFRVVKDIAITTAFNVKDSKTLRKLEVGELVEVLEFGKEDIGLPRLRCRALSDMKEGWVTERGNQGSLFLEKVAKPYFCCEEEVRLTAGFESTGEEVRRLQPGEVMETLEGPRKENPLLFERLKGKAVSDGKPGWVTLKDASGQPCFSATPMLVCKASIAITTTFDISQGKAIRKLEVGEVLDIVEEPKEDGQRSLTRVKARARKDDKEGFVTMKGNQGTAYVEETVNLYKCTKSVPLEARFTAGSTTFRMIAEGEVFEATDPPKVENKPGAQRIRVRALGDDKEGWFTMSKKNVIAWAPHYMCKMPSDLTKEVSASSEAVRQVQTSEVLEALECPVREGGASTLRVKVRAQSDGSVGFVTVREDKHIHLEPVFVE